MYEVTMIHEGRPPVERYLKSKLVDLFKKFPVIFLAGPRQAGKTTLTRMAFPGIPYFNLEDPSLRYRVMDDPHGFLKQYENGIILDEVQNFPDILSYIQIYADERNKPGQYLLTGSQNFLLNEKISQTLAGRVGILELLPLSYNEMFYDYSSSLLDIIFRGCYPRLYHNNMSPADFFSSYIQTYVERDVRQIKNIPDLNQFQKFLRLCAGRVGQVINYSSLGNDCGLSVPSVKKWLSILETSYIIYTLNPYSLNINTRITKTPKIYFYDTGLLCSLLEIKSINDLSLHFAYGSIFENFVISELLKTQCNKGERKNLYFLRDSKYHEIDCFIPLQNENLLCEIKSSATFQNSFVNNILYYRDKYPKAKGLVIYNGNESFKFKEVQIWPFEYMELDEYGLTIIKKIEKDLTAGEIQSVDDAYIQQEVSKLSITENVKDDVIRFITDRIRFWKIGISRKSGWESDSNDEMEQKFKNYYQDKDYIDIDELCDVTNYIPVSNISENERIFMRKVQSRWDITKECIDRLITEEKIQQDEKGIYLNSLIQKDTIHELVRSGDLNASFMNFLSKKYRGKKLLE
jgi:predicted AAA+ superfamily ATPase